MFFVAVQYIGRNTLYDKACVAKKFDTVTQQLKIGQEFLDGLKKP